jgi:Tol biopolymer transport system component
MGRFAPLIAAFFIAAFGGCTGTSSSDDGDIPGRGEWIVYSVAPTILGDAQLYRIRADGTQKLILTDPFNKSNDEAAWSPDGNLLIFSSSRDFPAGATPAQRMLWKTTLDGIFQTKVTQNTIQHCVEHNGQASPDNKVVVFTLACDNVLGGTPLIYKVNTDGTGQTRVAPDTLVAAHAEQSPVFSGNGGRIAFAASFGDPIFSYELYAMDADGKNTQRLTSLAAQGRTIIGRLTPIGNSVYFETASLPGLADAQLEAINIDGTGATVLYKIRNISIPGGGGVVPEDSDFGVSPNRQSIVFARWNANADRKMLMVAGADGTNPSLIDASGFASYPTWK